MSATRTRFEVIAMGRIGVDVYPLQSGVGLEDVQTFAKYLGGSASNVAVAAARHGRRTALITRTGEDPFGRFVHRALRGYGVDDRWITAVPGLPTPVTLCEIFPPDDFPIYFYREPKAPDLEIKPEELDYDAIRATGVFWATATGLCQEPSRSATLAAMESRGAGGITVVDLDYRPTFRKSREEDSYWTKAVLQNATVGVGNLDECETAVGEREPMAAAKAQPALLLGGEVPADPDAAFENMQKALALPTVKGTVAGRSLLYPSDDDVAGAVDTAVGLL